MAAAAFEIDARGLKCPLPVLKAEKQLSSLAPGQKLVVLADDPVARIDIPLLCQKNGHECEIAREESFLRFVITRA